MAAIAFIWHSNSQKVWEDALKRYWDYVRPENLELERRMDQLRLEDIAELDEKGWYEFLRDKYFRWKYTAPNRYATTTKTLNKYIQNGQLVELFDIKKGLLSLDISDISKSLSIAKEIHGLGIAGASGLLSLLYPHAFGTVDQFAIKALRQIPDLPYGQKSERMNPDNITLQNGTLVIRLMQDKASENNDIFGTNFWTPRKIDMVLWGARE